MERKKTHRKVVRVPNEVPQWDSWHTVQYVFKLDTRWRWKV